MDLEARNGNPANWQLATQPLSFKEPFRAAHWVRLAKTHNHSSSPFLNTASSRPLARAQVTSACDVPLAQRFSTTLESSFRPKMGIRSACRGRNFLTRMACLCYGLLSPPD